jgi:hypothetical protein
MRSLIVLLLLLLPVANCFAQRYVGSSADSARIEDADVGRIERLTLTLADGSSVEAPRIAKQTAFDRPVFSPDRRRAAWGALEPSCCTSYPIPTSLVVFRANRIERVIVEDQCIFKPVFVLGGSAIAYITAALHGDSGGRAHLRRLSDGKEIGKYIVPNVVGDDDSEQVTALRRAPKWVKEIHAFDQ